jgi:multidrug efflux pump subunit AcrA (membrane-fusion protein)
VVRFPVEVVAERPDPRLKPGMSARCTIIIARHRNILRLPADCVDGAGSEAQAQILVHSVKAGQATDSFTPRKVRVGLRGESHVEILDGLREGDRVKPGITQVPKRKAIDIDIK